MKKFQFLIFMFFSFSALAEGGDNLVADDHKENIWVVDYITKDSIHASVNGRVTHGDRLHVRFIKGKCDIVNLITFVATYSKNPDLIKLKNKYVLSKFMGKEITAKILFTSPFLMAHRSTVDLGLMPRDFLEKTLLRENLITMKYLDSKEIKITEYFDITENSWVNVGLSNALDKAYTMCKKL